MLEQEFASIIKFILDNLSDIVPYYHEVPQDFIVPAVYFPTPEITSDGDTLLTFSVEYSWYVKFFHKDIHSAYDLGVKSLIEFQRKKNLVPLVDESGMLTDSWIRLKDPVLKILDNAVQLTLAWSSYRPYNYQEAEKSSVFDFNIYRKQEDT